jgi:general secretion pathway protein G
MTKSAAALITLVILLAFIGVTATPAGSQTSTQPTSQPTSQPTTQPTAQPTMQPAFAEPAEDARESMLMSDLQTLRSQLELYKVQHRDNYPGMVGEVFEADLFMRQLTARTSAGGLVGNNPPDFPYGPYLQKMPNNPFLPRVTVLLTGGDGAPPGDGSSAWWFNTTTGKFSPNDATYKNK